MQHVICGRLVWFIYSQYAINVNPTTFDALSSVAKEFEFA
jgi:hypothetical protein